MEGGETDRIVGLCGKRLSRGWLAEGGLRHWQRTCVRYGMTRVQNCGMPHQRFVPAPSDLQPWLEAAVVVDCPAELAQSQFPAMVSSMLVVRLAGHVVCQGAQVPTVAWMSASTRATEYVHQGRVHAVGLLLRPEAAAALFASARGSVNAMRPMAELAGAPWAAVERDVLAAADDDARLDVLCQFIRATAAPPSDCEVRRRHALALLAAADSTDEGTGQRMGLSARQFERRFVAHWGMAPKQFQVIARLSSTLWHALANAPGSQGAELAVDQGYYDQSHMGRDVRRLAGQPLQALVQDTRTALSTHWPLQIGAQTQPKPLHQSHKPTQESLPLAPARRR